MPPLKGKIVQYDPQKGYGFIDPDDENSPDIFFHKSKVHKTDRGEISLSPGREVTYDIGSDGSGRPRAENVTVTSGSSTSPIDPGKEEWDCSGKIKSFHQIKGFGFIERPNVKDTFFRYTGFVQGVDPDELDLIGLEVEFDIIPSSQGPKAINIKPIENPSWQEQPGDTGEGSNR